MKNINEIASDWQKQGHSKPAQASNTSIKKQLNQASFEPATSCQLVVDTGNWRV